MPVHWTISHANRLVLAVAKGDVDAADIEAYFREVNNEGGMSYAKIFDMTSAPSIISDENIQTLGGLIQSYAMVGKIGPVAIVARSDESFRQAQVFATAAQADRLLQIFREQHEASKWLNELGVKTA